MRHTRCSRTPRRGGSMMAVPVFQPSKITSTREVNRREGEVGVKTRLNSQTIQETLSMISFTERTQTTSISSLRILDMLIKI